jgi:hypothetical protein
MSAFTLFFFFNIHPGKTHGVQTAPTFTEIDVAGIAPMRFALSDYLNYDGRLPQR